LELFWISKWRALHRHAGVLAARTASEKKLEGCALYSHLPQLTGRTHGNGAVQSEKPAAREEEQKKRILREVDATETGRGASSLSSGLTRWAFFLKAAMKKDNDNPITSNCLLLSPWPATGERAFGSRRQETIVGTLEKITRFRCGQDRSGTIGRSKRSPQRLTFRT